MGHGVTPELSHPEQGDYMLCALYIRGVGTYLIGLKGGEEAGQEGGRRRQGRREGQVRRGGQVKDYGVTHL